MRSSIAPYNPTNDFFFPSSSACFNQVGEVKVLRLSASKKFCFKGKRTAEDRRTQIGSLLRTGELSPRGVGEAEPAESFAAVARSKRELEGAEG